MSVLRTPCFGVWYPQGVRVPPVKNHCTRSSNRNAVPAIIILPERRSGPFRLTFTSVGVPFVFCKVLSCLLLQHDTADKNAVWNLRSRILISFKPVQKLLVTYLCNEMSLFCYIPHSFSYKRHRVYFTLQLIWGNAIFVSVVARFFTLSFVLQIVLIKLKTTA